MVFFEVAGNVLSLDISWIVGFVLSNLLWVFALAALSCFLFPKRNMFLGGLLIVSVLWLAADWTNAMGWQYLVGGFLALNYFSRFTIALFAETVPSLSKRLPLIFVIQFMVVLVIFNVFMG